MFFLCNMRYNSTTLCLLGVIAALAVIVIYMYMNNKNTEGMDSTQPRAEEAKPTNKEAGAGSGANGANGGSPCLVLFHATWCPHCKDVLPVWKKLAEGTKGGIQILDIESKNPAINNHQLPGFPTIRFFPQGMGVPANHQDYTGPRTLDGLVQYLSSM